MIGFVINAKGYLDSSARFWTKSGKYLENQDSRYDIISMWKEPRPTVTLTLPCPLKEPQEGMWLINSDRIAVESTFEDGEQMACYDLDILERGFYFASKEDAQAWLDALKESRR